MRRVDKAKSREEFKVRPVHRGEAGPRPAAVSRDLGAVEQTLQNGAKAEREGRLGHGQARAVTPEQMEISRLRAEVSRLRMEAEILKKAAAYFAKELL